MSDPIKIDCPLCDHDPNDSDFRDVAGSDSYFCSARKISPDNWSATSLDNKCVKGPVPQECPLRKGIFVVQLDPRLDKK